MGASAEFIAGVFGNISGLFLVLSPMITFYGIWRQKTTHSFSSIPYLCALINCILWLLYGMPYVTKNGILIMTINGVGALLELTYLSIFMIYAPKSGKIRTAQVGGCVGAFYLLVVLVVTFAVHHMQERHTIVGILCVIITIVMYAAPLSVMRLVIKTKSVEYMPLFLSVMVLLNSIAWSAFALLKNDLYIMIPNFFGVLLGMSQLILYACYYEAKKPSVREEVEMGGKATQQNGHATNNNNGELAACALDISNPSDVHLSHMGSAASLKDSSTTKVACSAAVGTSLPTSSAVAYSARTIRNGHATNNNGELAACALDISNPSDVHLSHMGSAASLKDSGTTKVASLPTYSAVAYSANTIRN